MVSLECLRCHNCESGRGCARGIATTDPELTMLITQDWGTQRIINAYAAWMKQWRSLLRRLGLNVSRTWWGVGIYWCIWIISDRKR